MKFLLEFVSCCGTINSNGEGGIGEDNSTSKREVLDSGEGPAEETRSFVLERRSRSTRKRGRGSSTSSVATAADWKPTLSAISENNVVVAGQRGGVERVLKRKGSVGVGGDGGFDKGGVRDIGSLSGYVDNHRRHRLTTIIPAFSPTPFMF